MDPGKMKVVELRAELGALGLDTKGNKPALVERLRRARELASGTEVAETTILDTSTEDMDEGTPVKRAGPAARTRRRSSSSRLAALTPARRTASNASGASTISEEEPSKTQVVDDSSSSSNEAVADEAPSKSARPEQRAVESPEPEEKPIPKQEVALSPEPEVVPSPVPEPVQAVEEMEEEVLCLDDERRQSPIPVDDDDNEAENGDKADKIEIKEEPGDAAKDTAVEVRAERPVILSEAEEWRQLNERLKEKEKERIRKEQEFAESERIRLEEINKDTIKGNVQSEQSTEPRKHKPWMNDEIRDTIKAKKLAWDTYRRSKEQQHYRVYRSFNHKVIELSRKAKSKYFSEVRRCWANERPDEMIMSDSEKSEKYALDGDITDALNGNVQNDQNTQQNNRPWIDDKIKDAIKAKDDAWDKYRESREQQHYKEYQSLNQTVTELTKKAKSKYFSEIRSSSVNETLMTDGEESGKPSMDGGDVTDPVKRERERRKREKKSRWSNFYRSVELTNEVLTPPTDEPDDKKSQERTQSARGKEQSPVRKAPEPELDENKVTLSWYDSDLNQYLEQPDLNSVVPLSEGAFAHCWAGARASHGVTSGRTCFEVKLLGTVSTTEETTSGAIRVGWSTADSSLHLGEGEHSWGYESSGRAVHNAEFKEFGRTLTEKDVVGAYLDLESSPCKVSYTVNGEELGTAFVFEKETLKEQALFPHVLTKNICYKVNLGADRYNLLTKTKIVRRRVEIPLQQVLDEKKAKEEVLKRQREEQAKKEKEKRDQLELERKERQLEREKAKAKKLKEAAEREKEQKAKDSAETGDKPKEPKEGEEPTENGKTSEPKDSDKYDPMDTADDDASEEQDKSEKPVESEEPKQAHKAQEEAEKPKEQVEQPQDQPEKPQEQAEQEPADQPTVQDGEEIKESAEPMEQDGEVQEVTEQQVYEGLKLDPRLKSVIRFVVDEELDGVEACLLPGYLLIALYQVDQLTPGPRRPASEADCEVILMVGLPGTGKTYWARQYAAAHAERRYNILSTGGIIDKMKVDCKPFRATYEGRWDAMVTKCAKCVLRLLEIAHERRRNYILDQTNVYPSAQRRKLREFGGYRRVAVVVVPDEATYEERQKRREEADGKEVPDGAIIDMKANFTLPEKCSWVDEVIYAELNEEECKKVLEKFGKEARAAGVQKEKEKRERSPTRGDGPPGKKSRQDGERRFGRDDRAHSGSRDRFSRDREDRFGGGGGGGGGSRWGPPGRGGHRGGRSDSRDSRDSRWGPGPRERNHGGCGGGRFDRNDRGGNWGRGGGGGGGGDYNNRDGGFRGGRGGPMGRGGRDDRGGGRPGPPSLLEATPRPYGGGRPQDGRGGRGGRDDRNSAGTWQRGGAGNMGGRGGGSSGGAPGAPNQQQGGNWGNQQQQQQQQGWGNWNQWNNWQQGQQGWGNWGNNWGNWQQGQQGQQTGAASAGGKQGAVAPAAAGGAATPAPAGAAAQQGQWPANYTAQQWYQWQQWQQQQWPGYQAGGATTADQQALWAQYYQNYGGAAAGQAAVDKK